MSEYTPTTDEVLRCYHLPMGLDQAQRDGESFAEFLSRRSIESFQQQIADREAAQRWLAEVERAAAEKAWDRCVAEMPIDPDWKNYYGDSNPYRRNEGEKA